VKELDENESLDLFNWKAFRQATTRKGFVELSRQIVAYSGGLPLALKVVGSSLYRRSSVHAWMSELDKLEVLPQKNVQRMLEDSVNNLSDEEKQIFLDIAYFFIGVNQKDVLQALNGSTQRTTLQISLLKDKSLLTIDENNKLQMHVLLQATARDIIRKESSIKTNQVSGSVCVCV
jgi:hypothetical protein